MTTIKVSIGLFFGLLLTSGCNLVWGIEDVDRAETDSDDGTADVSGEGGATMDGHVNDGTGGSTPNGPDVAGCGLDDPGEPNDVPAQAKRLPDLNTCDFGKTIESVMDGTDDWYAFGGTKNLIGGALCEKVEPWALSTSVSPLRVCYYVNGGPTSCPRDTERGADPVPEGYSGCCSSNAAAVVFDQPNAEVLVKVSAASPVDACFSYTLRYNY